MGEWKQGKETRKGKGEQREWGRKLRIRDRKNIKEKIQNISRGEKIGSEERERGEILRHWEEKKWRKWGRKCIRQKEKRNRENKIEK